MNIISGEAKQNGRATHPEWLKWTRHRPSVSVVQLYMHGVHGWSLWVEFGVHGVEFDVRGVEFDVHGVEFDVRELPRRVETSHATAEPQVVCLHRSMETVHARKDLKWCQDV